jgi:AdoMet-dependent rRNA methyltransferase SPB1
MSSADKRQGHQWKATRHDKFYKLAKEQGYRSRACFKLIHLNKLYDFLSTAHSVVDLCAAPGGWLQVCTKYMPVSSLVIGIDILPMKPLKNTIQIQSDITSQHCRTELKKSLQGWNLDVVLHDGAPDLGGSTWDADAFTQISLVVHSLKLATEFLRPGGWFVTKIFRSQDYNSLIWVLEKFFKKVEINKPPASRNASAEIFAVCQGFLAPKSFDKKLLDPNHLFKHIEKDKKIDPFAKNAPKRNRGGYDDGARMLYKEMTIHDFVETKDPIDVLGSHNKLVFDEASQVYREHTETTADIVELCEDLKVLGKGDLRTLLNWLRKMRQYKKELKKEEERDVEEEAEALEEEPKERDTEDSEDEIDENLAEMQDMLARAKTKARRKRLERKRKEAARLVLNGQTPFDIATDGQEEDGLFQLKEVKGKGALDAVMDQDEVVDVGESEDFSASEEVSLDENDAEAALEASLDANYKAYKARRGEMETKRRKKLGLEEEEDVELGEAGAAEEADETQEVNDDNHDDEDAEANPLLKQLGEGLGKPTQKMLADRFFSRDLFSGFDVTAPAETQKPKQKRMAKAVGEPQKETGDEGDEGEDSDSAGKGAEMTAAGRSRKTANKHLPGEFRCWCRACLVRLARKRSQ